MTVARPVIARAAEGLPRLDTLGVSGIRSGAWVLAAAVLLLSRLALAAAPSPDAGLVSAEGPGRDAGIASAEGPSRDAGVQADAQAAPKLEPRPDDSILERYRTPWEALNERKIGEATRAVRFDWRKMTVGFGLEGSQLLELNNFGSARFGGFLRRPVSSLLVELAVTWVFSSSSDSATKLALTPYRQFGRPSRLEIDLNVGLPLAEGVSTSRLGFMPATEFVFSFNAGLRYRYYTNAFGNAQASEILKDMFGLNLSQLEHDNLDGKLPPAMQLDTSRYSLLVGCSLDVYFQPGFFLSPRVMITEPLTSAIKQGGLGVWWELNIAAGWAL